jgi:drug/metabolite transporter (DMT)-like permease
MSRTNLQWKPIAVLLTLCLIWGANMAVVKIGAREIPSLFMAGVRSAVAAMCVYIWMKFKGVTVFPSGTLVLHGVIIGILFGSEFALIYVGLEYTSASRTYILLYVAPFFVAIGAHFFLKGDRLNTWKFIGLIFAFVGIVVLFIKNIGPFSLGTIPGDLMALGAGFLWGVTTVYVKKYVSHQVQPLQTLFYQVFFSAPLLLILSMALEVPVLSGITLTGWLSMFFQCIIIAFLSYLVWFEMIHRYPVSLLHAFSFFTPVFGVFLSGALILGEIISPSLVIALILVCLGMIFVNRAPKAAKASKG